MNETYRALAQILDAIREDIGEDPDRAAFELRALVGILTDRKVAEAYAEKAGVEGPIEYRTFALNVTKLG